MGLLRPGQIKRMAGLINLQANATLLKLGEPGPISDSGDADGYIERWAGEAPAILDTSTAAVQLRGNTTGTGVTVELADDNNRTTLTVLDGVAPVIARAGQSWDGWQVTVRDERLTPPVTVEYIIDEMVHEACGLLDSVTWKLKA